MLKLLLLQDEWYHFGFVNSKLLININMWKYIKYWYNITGAPMIRVIELKYSLSIKEIASVSFSSLNLRTKSILLVVYISSIFNFSNVVNCKLFGWRITSTSRNGEIDNSFIIASIWSFFFHVELVGWILRLRLVGWDW